MKTLQLLTEIDKIDYEAWKIGIHQDAKRLAALLDEYDPVRDFRDFFGDIRRNLLKARNDIDFLLIKLERTERLYKGPDEVKQNE